MSLYLCALSFHNDIEREEFGVEVGTYDYFGRFRDYVLDKVECGIRGDICPLIMMHSDCDGFFTPAESELIISELKIIKSVFEQLPPDADIISLRQGVIVQETASYNALYDCFTDIDGCRLIDRLLELFMYSVDNNINIYFQ